MLKRTHDSPGVLGFPRILHGVLLLVFSRGFRMDFDYVTTAYVRI